MPEVFPSGALNSTHDKFGFRYSYAKIKLKVLFWSWLSRSHLTPGVLVHAFYLRSAVLLLGGLLVGSPAWAAPWKAVLKQPGEMRDIDTVSLKRDGHRFMIWETDDYAKAHADAPGNKATYKSRIDQSAGAARA